MRSTLLTVASLALLAYCVCAPTEEEVIQHVPPKVPTPSDTGKDGAKSGAVVVESPEPKEVRVRRSIGGQESDLLPSAGDVDAVPIGQESQFEGHGRIRVLPAFLG